MKKTVTCIVAALLTAGCVWAQTSSVTVENAGTFNYGDCAGFRIDFDATPSGTVVWTPPLVSGETYFLNSVSIKYGGSQANTLPKYLGVYSGFSGGVLSGFLGVSDYPIDFTLLPAGAWTNFTFSGITVTVDSTVGSGSGLLNFVYQTEPTARTGVETGVSTRRNEGFPTEDQMPIFYANIIATWGAVIPARAPQYQATLTVVPEPSAVALISLAGAAFVFARRRLAK